MNTPKPRPIRSHVSWSGSALLSEIDEARELWRLPDLYKILNPQAWINDIWCSLQKIIGADTPRCPEISFPEFYERNVKDSLSESEKLEVERKLQRGWTDFHDALNSAERLLIETAPRKKLEPTSSKKTGPKVTRDDRGRILKIRLMRLCFRERHKYYCYPKYSKANLSQWISDQFDEHLSVGDLDRYDDKYRYHFEPDRKGEFASK